MQDLQQLTIACVCMRIMLIKNVNQKLRKQQSGEQNVELNYTLCCTKEVTLQNFDTVI